MKNITIVLTLVCCLFFTSACNNTSKIDMDNKITKVVIAGKEKIELETKILLDNKVSIFIPKSFKTMSEEDAKYKYPSERRPNLIYTNEDASINVAFNHTTSNGNDKYISNYKDYLQGTLKKIYPSATWYSDDILKINGKKVGIIELLTPAVDTQIYNLIFFTELEDRLLLISFNCTESQMKDWKPVAKEIMNSIKTN